ncbi:MAG: EAL domain-containing protein [Pseudomonadota bacterium]
MPAERRGLIPLLAALLLAALGLLLGGWLLRGELAARFEDEAGARLGLVAQAKARHLAHWLEERYADARVACQGSLLARETATWLTAGRPPGARENAIREQLRMIRDNHGYRAIGVFDRAGFPVLATGGDLPVALHGADALRAMAARRPVLVDVHRHGPPQPGESWAEGAALGIAAPLCPEGPGVGPVVGAVYFALRGEDFLFDLLKNWRVLETRVETRLTRAEGGWVLVFTPGPRGAHSLHLPADRHDYVAARASRGARGLIRGVNHRGAPILAWAEAVPGTPWILIAKQDRAELQARLDRTLGWLAGAGALLYLLVSALLWLSWHARGERQRRRALEERLARAAVEERHAALLREANDIVLLADGAGRVVEANARAAAAYGRPREELVGRPLADLRAEPEDAAAYAEDMERLAREGAARYETRHRRQDGTVFPVEVSASLVEAGGERLLLKIVRDISERRAHEARIRELAYFDALTGLPNRVLLQDRLQQFGAHIRRAGEHLAVLSLDLDRFRQVNDSLGHAVGDALLVEAAARLTACARAEDTVARLGGDEFVFLLHADHGGAARVAQKLLARLAEPFRVAGHELSCGASMGIAVCPDDGEDAEAMLRAADIALARARQAGGGRFRFYQADMQTGVKRRLRLETALRGALARGELSLHYQPQAEAASGTVTGVEALMRWCHPEWGWVSPAEFIPVAEDTGLIAELGDWAFETAIAQAAAWRAAGRDLTMAVNLSVAQLRDADLAERVLALLRRAGLPPDRLEIEVTESLAMREAAQAESLLLRLAEAGVRLAIDDFGTGYSSLASLKRFHVHVLKIDASFVAGLPDDRENAAISAAVVRMAEALGAHTLAEGVETAAQLEALRAMGCRGVQGYFLARPMPAQELDAWLARGGNGHAAT